MGIHVVSVKNADVSLTFPIKFHCAIFKVFILSNSIHNFVFLKFCYTCKLDQDAKLFVFISNIISVKGSFCIYNVIFFQYFYDKQGVCLHHI